MRIFVAFVALATIGGIQDACSPDDPIPGRAPCVGQVVLVQLGEPILCDVLPGQTIVEVGTPEEYCLDEGGFWYSSLDTDKVTLCIDLDN